ncbi:MAG: hypothetical protein KC435_07560 [Thermomicrobiales bacterium]|nr:hypothetical protein [Thermomicrobiales bacterium]
MPSQVLWLWDDAPIPSSAAAIVIPSRELRSHPLTSPVAMSNAFILWAISKETQQVIIDDGSWRASLTSIQLADARAQQIRLGRGLCFPGEWVPRLQREETDGRLVFDQRLWESMSDDEQRTVIQNQLIDWDEPITLPIPDGAPTHIRGVTNRFLPTEGVNCFAIAIYAATQRESLLHQWLVTEDFQTALSGNGFGERESSDIVAGDILTFATEMGIIHAAYALGADRFLNKNGQSMFNPVRIVDLATLQREWPESELSVWRRS